MDGVQNHTHNLDEGIVEYFEFVLFGHSYKFKQPSTEEIDELVSVKDDPEKIDQLKEFFYKFITPASEGAESFAVVAKKMTIPHWKRFNAMVAAEVGLDAGN